MLPLGGGSIRVLARRSTELGTESFTRGSKPFTRTRCDISRRPMQMGFTEAEISDLSLAIGRTPPRGAAAVQTHSAFRVNWEIAVSPRGIRRQAVRCGDTFLFLCTSIDVLFVSRWAWVRSVNEGIVGCARGSYSNGIAQRLDPSICLLLDRLRLLFDQILWKTGVLRLSFNVFVARVLQLLATCDRRLSAMMA